MLITLSSPLKFFIAFGLAQILFGCDTDLFSSHQHSIKNHTLTLKSQSHSASSSPWEVEQVTEKKYFQVKFGCQQKPFVGDFQVCDLKLMHADKAVSNAVISIDGGMKAHGHGLPTSPKIEATNIHGHYKIEGLKFSMPGDWIVGFKVVFGEISDQVVFKFSI